MKFHTAALGFLALTVTLGLVVAQDRPAREPAPAPPGESRPRHHRRGSQMSGPSPTCSPLSSKPTTPRIPRPSAPCSRRRPRSRTRTARSRGAETPSSPRFAETFAGSEAGTLAVNTESLRFLGTDLAIEEGASLTLSAEAPPLTPTGTA